MTQKQPIKNRERTKAIIYENGRIYFTKETERRACFFLTIFMMVLGIIYHFAGL